MFGAGPSVLKHDYAKWELANPSVNFAISSRTDSSGLDHVGIQAENAEELKSLQARLDAAGIAGKQQTGTACSYARNVVLKITAGIATYDLN